MTSLPAQESRPPMSPPPRGYDQPAGINPWFIRLPLLTIIGGVLLVGTLAAFVAAYQMRYTDRIVPGVSAFGVDLGGMSRDEAIAALSDRFTYDAEAVFTFRHGDRFWQMTAGELGVSFDVEATVDAAYATGGSGRLARDLADQAEAWFNGVSVAPIIAYDQNVAVAQLREMAAEIDQDSADATLTIDGTTVITTQGQVGRRLDIPATLARLDEIVLQMRSGAELPLVVNETPPRVWNADSAASRARAALSGPLELVADAPGGETLGPWSATAEQIASLLTVQLIDNGDGTASYDVSVNMTAFASFLETLAPGLVTEPENGRFHFNDSTSQLEVISPATEGRHLNVSLTLARLEEAVFRFDSRTVPMAFDYILPRYHNNITAAELGITGLVSEATTYYTGSPPNRIHNITEGASRFDGIIIGPGEEFSFNQWLGDVSEEAGFVESKVIEGERTVDGVGGGICQVSTTAFRAAFFGGYRITERNSHSYRVGFYELNAGPGLDAAIWTPTQDMRFLNDTDYHMLIEVSVYPANNALQFRYYSTNPGRQVTIEEPIIRNPEPPPPTRYEVDNELQPGQSLQAEWAADGADVYVTRIIRDPQGNIIAEDDLYTHYLAWGAVILVPPGDSRAVSTGG